MLLQIFHRVCQYQNFENRSIFGEAMYKSLDARLACFLTIGVGEGDRGTCPHKIREKYFLGNNYVKFVHFSDKNHVKFRNFVNFSGKYHRNSGIFIICRARIM